MNWNDDANDNVGFRPLIVFCKRIRLDGSFCLKRFHPSAKLFADFLKRTLELDVIFKRQSTDVFRKS